MEGALLCPPLPRRRGAAWHSSPSRPSPPTSKHFLRKGQDHFWDKISTQFPNHCRCCSYDLLSVEAGVASTEPDEEGGEQDGSEEKPQAGDQLHLLDGQPVHGPELSLPSRKHLTGCMYTQRGPSAYLDRGGLGVRAEVEGGLLCHAVARRPRSAPLSLRCAATDSLPCGRRATTAPQPAAGSANTDTALQQHTYCIS